MRNLTLFLGTVWGSAAVAHHDQTPLREAYINGHSHDVGGATLWLVAAVIAMCIALYAVHWSIFRKN